MTSLATIYLTIIPRAPMGSESKPREAVRARGITVLDKTKQLIKNIETKQL